jgi:hypothetical protein
MPLVKPLESQPFLAHWTRGNPRSAGIGRGGGFGGTGLPAKALQHGVGCWLAMAVADGEARVAAWLADLGGTIGPVASSARDLLDDGMPGARHALKWGNPTWVGHGNVAAILAHGGHVNLQFFRGAELADPGRLLQGTGQRMRHLRLGHARDARTPAVKAIVRSAWRLDKEDA